MEDLPVYYDGRSAFSLFPACNHSNPDAYYEELIQQCLLLQSTTPHPVVILSRTLESYCRYLGCPFEMADELHESYRKDCEIWIEGRRR